MRPQVIVTDFVTEPLDIEREILKDVADVTALNVTSEEQLEGRIESAAAIMLYHSLPLTRRTIDRLTQCRLIVRCGVGVDNVDHAYAATRGIAVSNVPDYGTEEVADSAMGLLLTLMRGIHMMNTRLQRGEVPWSYIPTVPLHRLRGRVLGMVGLGRIGQAMALRAKAFGMDVVFYDPPLADGYDKALGIRRASTLKELLSQSHVVSLNCPLTEETRHLINRETLGWLPRGAYLVNTARGGIVDPEALLEAIESGRLAGAGIDVLELEPPTGREPLLKAWRDPNHPASTRLVLNPHSAFYSEEGLRDMRIRGAENCLRALRGEALRNRVNG